MINALRIRERKTVGTVVMVFVFLTRRADRISKPVVHPHEAAAGYMRQHAVKNLTPVCVSIVAEVKEITNNPARLGPAPAIGLFNAYVGKRIDIAGRVHVAACTGAALVSAPSDSQKSSSKRSYRVLAH